MGINEWVINNAFKNRLRKSKTALLADPTSTENIEPTITLNAENSEEIKIKKN